MFIPDHRLSDSADRHGHTVVGGPLFLYNLVRAVPDALVNAVHGLHMIEISPQFTKMI